MLRTIWPAMLVVAALTTAADIAAAQSSSKGGVENNGIVIDLRTPSRARSEASAALLSKAAAKGQVRVIVGMTDRVKAGHTLEESEERAQIETLRASQQALARRAGVPDSDVVTFEYIPFVSMWVNAAQLGRLLADPSVVNIQEDLPGDTGLAQSVPKIAAPTLWQQGFTGKGWTIAVLDTGVDKAHSMFKHKVVSEACYSTKNTAQGIQSTCPGGVTQSTKPGSGVDCKPRGFGQCFHGTHVAGIAAGHQPALNGVAKDSKIIAIQVFAKQGKNSVTFDSDWIKGLNRVYALRSKFKIASVNMSLGRGRFTGQCDSQSPAALAIIKQLRGARIATLVASMNDSWNGDMRLPACISAAIAVGSTTKQDQISSFSNHALQVRHMAPGSDINSAKPGGGYQVLSGTSMATPHVAGAYALLRDVRTNATVDDIAAALECTGVPVTRVGVTERRINVAQAKKYMLNPPRATKEFPFNNAGDGNAWFAHVGGWIVANGHLQIKENSRGWKVATTSNCNEGVNITARIGKSTTAAGVIGLLFKAQFTGAFVGGYFAGFNPPNSIVLLRLDGYNLQNDSGLFKQFPCANRAVNVNNYNIVTVQSRGGLHKLFINGTLACSATDYTYGTGRLGVATFVNPTTTFFGADYFTIDPVESVPSSAPTEDEFVSASAPASAEPEGISASGSAGSINASLSLAH